MKQILNNGLRGGLKKGDLIKWQSNDSTIGLNSRCRGYHAEKSKTGETGLTPAKIEARYYCLAS